MAATRLIEGGVKAGLAAQGIGELDATSMLDEAGAELALEEPSERRLHMVWGADLAVVHEQPLSDEERAQIDVMATEVLGGADLFDGPIGGCPSDALAIAGILSLDLDVNIDNGPSLESMRAGRLALMIDGGPAPAPSPEEEHTLITVCEGTAARRTGELAILAVAMLALELRGLCHATAERALVLAAYFTRSLMVPTAALRAAVDEIAYGVASDAHRASNGLARIGHGAPLRERFPHASVAVLDARLRDIGAPVVYADSFRCGLMAGAEIEIARRRDLARASIARAEATHGCEAAIGGLWSDGAPQLVSLVLGRLMQAGAIEDSCLVEDEASAWVRLHALDFEAAAGLADSPLTPDQRIRALVLATFAMAELSGDRSGDALALRTLDYLDGRISSNTLGHEAEDDGSARMFSAAASIASAAIGLREGGRDHTRHATIELVRNGTAGIDSDERARWAATVCEYVLTDCSTAIPAAWANDGARPTDEHALALRAFLRDPSLALLDVAAAE